MSLSIVLGNSNAAVLFFSMVISLCFLKNALKAQTITHVGVLLCTAKSKNLFSFLSLTSGPSLNEERF